MSLGMTVDESYEAVRPHETVTQFVGYCEVCDKDVVFDDYKGRKGGDSYSYCVCTKCGGVDTWN